MLPLAQQPIEAGAHRGRIVPALQSTQRDMHLRHLLVVVHERAVQRGTGGGLRQRHCLSEISLRQHRAEPRGDLADQQAVAGRSAAMPGRPKHPLAPPEAAATGRLNRRRGSFGVLRSEPTVPMRQALRSAASTSCG
jgi:hypothetical protein